MLGFGGEHRFSKSADTSLAVSVSDSGERLITVWLRNPVPQEVWDSYSSGLAVQTIQQRHALCPVGEVFEEGEHRRVSPVDVLDDQHQWVLFGDRLQEACRQPVNSSSCTAASPPSIPSSGNNLARSQGVSADCGKTASSFPVATAGESVS